MKWIGISILFFLVFSLIIDNKRLFDEHNKQEKRIVQLEKKIELFDKKVKE
jgi:hypothetical protein